VWCGPGDAEAGYGGRIGKRKKGEWKWPRKEALRRRSTSRHNERQVLSVYFYGRLELLLSGEKRQDRRTQRLYAWGLFFKTERHAKGQTRPKPKQGQKRNPTGLGQEITTSKRAEYPLPAGDGQSPSQCSTPNGLSPPYFWS